MQLECSCWDEVRTLSFLAMGKTVAKQGPSSSFEEVWIRWEGDLSRRRIVSCQTCICMLDLQAKKPHHYPSIAKCNSQHDCQVRGKPGMQHTWRLHHVGLTFLDFYFYYYPKANKTSAFKRRPMYTAGCRAQPARCPLTT